MLLVDTGPLVAAAGISDRDHERCARLLEGRADQLVVPALVISEVAYFLADRHGAAAERAFIGSCESGELYVEPVEPNDWKRIGELLDQYADLEIGTVDASVLAACERLGVTELATLNRRHFSVVKPLHCDALELLPE